MKKLFLMTMVLLAAAACSQDETTSPAAPGGTDAIEPPHFYGMATLDNEAPQTRGVANKLKQWSKSMVELLTVKFLNGSPEYIDFVKQAAVEWEKAAGVRFIFVPSTMDAMIRIGFDYIPEMKTSWSYTGTDIMQLYNFQDQPTIHFASGPASGMRKNAATRCGLSVKRSAWSWSSVIRTPLRSGSKMRTGR